MGVFDSISSLKSFRTCTDEVIPRKVVGKIAEAGRQAVSPGNVQSLEFVVVEDHETKEHLAHSVGDDRVEHAPTVIAIVADIERMKRNVHGDPVQHCAMEVACAVQNIRLTAEEEDVSSCWVTGFDEDDVNRILEVPSSKRTMALVPLASSAEEMERPSRFGMNQTLFYDLYGNQEGNLFDGWEWRGYREEKEIYSNRAKGLLTKLKRVFR